MELLLKNTPNAGYELNDIVVIMNDATNWGSEELNSNKFTIIKNIAISDVDKNLATMADEQFKNIAAISHIPAFRHSLFKIDNMQSVKRRKYTYNNNKVELK